MKNRTLIARSLVAICMGCSVAHAQGIPGVVYSGPTPEALRQAGEVRPAQQAQRSPADGELLAALARIQILQAQQNALLGELVMLAHKSQTSAAVLATQPVSHPAKQ